MVMMVEQTDRLTNKRTLVVVESLLRLKKLKSLVKLPFYFQQVMYYDPESKSHGQWSRKRQYSTLRPGSGRRGHLGEDVRRRGEAGPGGGGGGGQNHQQEDKVDDHSEEDDQKEQHQKQRYNGLLNSSRKLQAGNAA